MATGGSFRRQLGSDIKVDSPNLRDFLRMKEDDNNNYNGRGQTLGSVLSGEKRGGAGPPERIQSIRTLLDIIREDPPPSGANVKDGKKSWKYIKDILRLRRQGSGSSWTSSVPVPTSDVPINMPVSDGSGLPRTRSTMFQRNASRAVEEASEEAERAAGDSTEEEVEAAGEVEDGGESEQPVVRMSLMALLEETDGQMGIDGLAADEEDEEEEEEEKGGGGGEYSACCVCMVRHKGSAFIPCGHTFCRLCSRELWVQRRNCPLCNNFILEILDIF